MAIQAVKGAPGTVYVIKGTNNPLTIAQSFAQTVSREKYRMMEQAQQAAKLQLQADMDAYKIAVQEGRAVYAEELALAQRQEQLRQKELADLKKLKLQTEEDIATWKTGGIKGAAGEGRITTSTRDVPAKTSKDPQQAQMDANETNIKEYEALIEQIDNKINDRTSGQTPTQKQNAEREKKKYEELLATTKESQEKLKKERPDLVPFGGAVIRTEGGQATTTTTSRPLSAGNAQDREAQKAARDEEIKRLEALLQTTISDIEAKEAETVAMPTRPELPEAPRLDLIGRTGEIAQTQLGARPGSLVKSRQTPPQVRGFDLSNKEGQREYLYSLIAPPPNVPPEAKEPIPGEPVEEVDLSALSEPMPLNIGSNYIQEPTAGPAPMDMLETPRGETPSYAQARNLQRDILPEPVPPPMTMGTPSQTPLPQAPSMNNAPFLYSDPRALELATLYGDEPIPEQPKATKQQKINAQKLKTLNKGMQMNEKKVNRLTKQTNKPEWVLMVQELYNPPRTLPKDKRDALFTNAYKELEVVYKDDPKKKKQAQELLTALHFMNEQ